MPVVLTNQDGHEYCLSTLCWPFFLPLTPTQIILWKQVHLKDLLLSRVQLFSTPWTAAHQASPSFTISWSLANSCPLRWGCHPIISSSVIPFCSCPQMSPASGSITVSQLFTSGGQSTGASASASVLPMNIEGWFLLGLTGLISLSK